MSYVRGSGHLAPVDITGDLPVVVVCSTTHAEFRLAHRTIAAAADPVGRGASNQQATDRGMPGPIRSNGCGGASECQDGLHTAECVSQSGPPHPDRWIGAAKPRPFPDPAFALLTGRNDCRGSLCGNVGARCLESSPLRHRVVVLQVSTSDAPIDTFRRRMLLAGRRSAPCEEPLGQMRGMDPAQMTGQPSD
jgi:hypothetical protein